MLDIQSAKDKVSKILAGMCPAGDRWSVQDDRTIERPFGWIFFYNSEKFLTTKNVIHSLAGNGPVFVNRKTGEISVFGSTPPLAAILTEYETS